MFTAAWGSKDTLAKKLGRAGWESRQGKLGPERLPHPAVDGPYAPGIVRMMSHFSSEDEALLQSMLRQLLQSVKEKITGAPSVECSEEILLHLEETDENFHNYEFVKYLRQYISSTLGSVIEEETEKCTSAQNQGEGTGYDTLVQHVTKKTRESKEYREMMHSLKNVMMVVVESLINKFEEDHMRSKEMQRKVKTEQHSSYHNDNCSDSDSSFNQSYTFMNQEQLQLLVERLDPSQPKEVRQEAMQTLCSAPPSDILNCESWTNLRKHLAAALLDPDPNFSANPDPDGPDVLVLLFICESVQLIVSMLVLFQGK
ncbi:UNVERIFIED_CONTAM: hypothetical protein K2H54_071206 [Gekko kuhli]